MHVMHKAQLRAPDLGLKHYPASGNDEMGEIEQAENLLCGDSSEIARGFIGDDERGISDNRAGDGDTLCCWPPESAFMRQDSQGQTE
jgi:hypothetical protein